MNRACTLTAMDYSRPFQGGGRGIIWVYLAYLLEVFSVVTLKEKGPLVVYVGVGRMVSYGVFFFPLDGE